MWTAGGQPDLLTFAGMRGGGKGGRGGGTDWRTEALRETSLVDPTTGEVYTSTPWSVMQGGKSAADQLNERIRARMAEQQTAKQQAAEQEKQQAAADATTNANSEANLEKTFQERKSSAYNTALADAMASFQKAGVDPNNYLEKYINPSLARISAGIQDKDPNPLAAFPTSLGASIVDQATADRRNQLTNQYNTMFGANYSNTALPDTLTGSYIDQILKEQFDPLRSQLQNAQKRNTLTGTGYQAALDRLTQKESSARSTISDLGSNILSGYRSSLDDLISGGRSNISSLSLGGAFDPTEYQTRASNLVKQDVGNFGGALRGAVGNSQFADLTDLLNAGGNVQGAFDPLAATNPYGGGNKLKTPDEDLATRKRGLGNTGAF